MFKDKGARKAINDLQDMFNERIANLSISIGERILRAMYVECEKCGCLVSRQKAIKVQALVDKDVIQSYLAGLYGGVLKDSEPEKEIKTTFYCKFCKNKLDK